MKESFERYVAKMSRSKKVHDYLAMRKKRCRSKSCSIWPSSGTENTDSLTERSFTVTVEGKILKLQFITSFQVKEYGLYVLDPVKPQSNPEEDEELQEQNGDEKSLIEKIPLAVAEQGEILTVESVEENIEFYQGRFYVYVVTDRGKMVKKSNPELVIPYTVENMAVSTPEVYYFCGLPMEFCAYPPTTCTASLI